MRKQNQYHELLLNAAYLRQVWLLKIVMMLIRAMQSAVLPGNGSVVLRKVYKVDCKWHGAHCQHIHNFEG